MNAFRMAHLHLFLCGFLLAFAASGQTNAPTTANGEQAEATILISALNQRGQPVHEISKESLIVQIDGKPVEIEGLRLLKDVPLIFSMVLDISGSTRSWSERQSATAVQLFRILSAENNHGYLVLFNQNVRESFNYIEAQNVEEIVKKTERKGPTALYDAIVFACTRQLHWDIPPTGARRAIIVISDGEDNVSRYRLDKAIETVQRERVPVFSVMISDDTNSKKRRKQAFNALQALSENTGGLVILPDRQQEEMIRGLPNLLEGQAIVTFKAPELKPRKSHSLKVRAQGNDLHILTPNEYFAQ